MWLVSVRYGEMRFISNFKTNLADLKMGNKCVVRTDRGTEVGVVISNPEQLPAGQEAASMGEVLRRFGPQDTAELQKIEKEKKPQVLTFCRAKIKELNLPMDVVYVEYILGGEKISLYFLANGRVDFRELVKELAREYKTRIEMRQIGVRDEARLLADTSRCGQELCCRTFIKELEPVTMKMAKGQKTTLDPLKISGHCGRLMCCLRFEDATYAELKSRMPRKGAIVKIAKGTGEVVNIDPLSQKVTVELGGNNKAVITANEIIEIIKEPTLKVDEADNEELE